ncbi:FadR/GntR family transcriptional regulator [Microbacterium sp. X-17]|uniref:FadR/GntR family transcriptional regulator n=1 Tax=Microbacterium sp. X-17 TaxID=3144404 RepID=UPI0031F58C1A
MSSTLPKFELAQRESLESELTRKLMDYLVTAKLRPGDRLPSERDMAESLGVGRAALRAALKSLSVLGVLEQRMGAGTYMKNVASDLLPRVVEWGLLLGESKSQDVLEARQYLEVTLAGLAAERRTRDDVEKMRDLIARMAESSTDAALYIDLDVAFHLAIADAARNTVLAGILRNLQSLLHAWATRVINAAGETETSLAVHIPILEAIEASDPDAARAAMSAHMERASRRFRAAILSQNELMN